MRREFLTLIRFRCAISCTCRVAALNIFYADLSSITRISYRYPSIPMLFLELDSAKSRKIEKHYRDVYFCSLKLLDAAAVRFESLGSDPSHVSGFVELHRSVFCAYLVSTLVLSG